MLKVCGGPVSQCSKLRCKACGKHLGGNCIYSNFSPYFFWLFVQADNMSPMKERKQEEIIGIESEVKKFAHSHFLFVLPIGTWNTW